MYWTRLCSASLLVWLASCGGSVISYDTSDSHGGGSSQDGSIPDAAYAGAGGMAGAGPGGGAGEGGTAGMGGAAGCASLDLSSDPANCGACHHDCLGGACAAGLCQPAEIGQVGPMSEGHDVLFADDSHLFLVSRSSGLTAVAKMPKTGGVLEEVIPATPLRPLSLARLGTSIFFSDQLEKAPHSFRILELPLSGGELSVLYDAGHSWALDLTPDGDGLLFLTEGAVANESVRVMRLRPADGVAEELAEFPGDSIFSQVSSDDEWAYLLAPSPQTASTDPPSASLHRISKADLTTQLIATWQPGGVYGVIPAGSALYYLSSEGSSQLDSLMRMPKSGGQSTLVLDVDPSSSIQPVAFDEQRVWWLQRQGDWSVPEVRFMTTPLSGGVSTFVAGDVLASNVAHDSTCLYWIRKSGAIMRLVR